MVESVQQPNALCTKILLLNVLKIKIEFLFYCYAFVHNHMALYIPINSSSPATAQSHYCDFAIREHFLMHTIAIMYITRSTAYSISILCTSQIDGLNFFYK